MSPTKSQFAPGVWLHSSQLLQATRTSRWEPRLRYAAMLRAYGSKAKAEEILTDLIEICDEWDVYAEYVGLLIDVDDMRRAEVVCRRALASLKSESELSEAFNILGVIHLRNENAAAALLEFERSYELDGDAVDALLGRADALRSLGRFVEACEAYGDVCNRGELLYQSYSGLALCCFNLSRYRDAVSWQQRAIKERPRHSDAYFNMGCMLAAKGEVHSALSAYDMAIALNASSSAALANRSEILLALGMMQRAAVDALGALEINPDDATASRVVQVLTEELGLQ